jgi:hypothetical protein
MDRVRIASLVGGIIVLVTYFLLFSYKYRKRMCGHVTLLLLLCSVLECGQIKIAVAVVIRYCMNNESLGAESFWHLDVT